MAKAPLARGRIDGDHVRVDDRDEARRLAAKAQAGTAAAGGALTLSRVEAAYCVAAGWLQVQGKDAVALDPLALVAPLGGGGLAEYLAYRDLRSRGLVARPAGPAACHDVWPRGAGEGAPLLRVWAQRAEDPVPGPSLARAADEGLVCAVVDADAVLTHYRVGWEEPGGEVPPYAGPDFVARAVGDRMAVRDAAVAEALAAAFLGSQEGELRILSALEAEALRADGRLRPDGPWLPSPPPAEQVAAVRALRARGVAAKSGLRFGTHLRAYRSDPDQEHADWLVHCVPAGGGLAWSDLARGVRLAHGVRKRFLVALDGAGGHPGVRFVHVAWTRL